MRSHNFFGQERIQKLSELGEIEANNIKERLK